MREKNLNYLSENLIFIAEELNRQGIKTLSVTEKNNAIEASATYFNGANCYFQYKANNIVDAFIEKFRMFDLKAIRTIKNGTRFVFTDGEYSEYRTTEDGFVNMYHSKHYHPLENKMLKNNQIRLSNNKAEKITGIELGSLLEEILSEKEQDNLQTRKR